MSLKRLAFAVALAFGLGGAAQAAERTSPDEIAAAARVEYTKKGGHHGWKHHGGKHAWKHGGRGHHYGWYKPRRHYGHYRPHRAYGYAPTYRYRNPYATGSTRRVGGMYHPGKHKGWNKHRW